MLEKMLHQAKRSGQIDAIYLFGSFLKGNNNVCSDVDLIIVSDFYSDFSQYIRRKMFLSQYGQDTCIKLDPVCMTNREFERYRNSEAYIKEKPIKLFGGLK